MKKGGQHKEKYKAQFLKTEINKKRKAAKLARHLAKAKQRKLNRKTNG